MQQPSVLHLVADDWSPIAGCYGNRVIRTPNVDHLAGRGIRFTHAFCCSPSCAASRATVLSGLHSHAHGQYGHCHGAHTFRVIPGIRTLPAMLRDAGIASALIGKDHTHPPELFPWTVTAPKVAGDPLAVRDGAGRFLDHVAGRQFYLQVAITQPHRTGQGFGNDRPVPGYQPQRYEPETVVVPGFLPDIPEVRSELADYYAAVSRMDYAFGLVVDALRAAGRDHDTMIIVQSDHGMPFPGAKASPYDSGHHCPLIVVPPGGCAPGINHAMTNWTDIMPTVLDLMGVKNPPPMHGRSFLPVLHETEPSDWQATTFSHSFHEVTNYYPYRVIRQRRYKYVLNLASELTLPLPLDLLHSETWKAIERDRLPFMGQRRTKHVLRHPAEELYDTINDPEESTNLISQPELQDLVASLRQDMAAFRSSSGDVFLAADSQAHLDRLFS